MAKIFVVDDDPAIVELVRRRLELKGHEIHVATEAIGTTRKIRELKPDVLVLDQQMPALSGTSIVKVLNESLGGNAGKRPKVLLFSSLPHDELSAKAAEVGADAYLCKTDGMEALEMKVRELLGK
ncbi:MAG: response regulator [Bdellovibrionota bacterium]